MVTQYIEVLQSYGNPNTLMLQYSEVLQSNEGYHRIATLQYIGLP